MLFNKYFVYIFSYYMVYTRQWPEVYDSCHTFLHVAQVKKHTAMRESHAFRTSHGRVFFY